MVGRHHVRGPQQSVALIFALFGGVLLFVLSCIYNGHYSKERVKADNSIITAEKLLVAGQWHAALSILTEVSDTGFCVTKCKLYTGTIYNKQGNFSRGRDECTNCLSTSYIGLGEHSLALPYLGQILTCHNRSTLSIDTVQETYKQLFYVYTETGNSSSVELQEIISAYANLTKKPMSIESAKRQLDCSYVSRLVDLGRFDRALQYIEGSATSDKSTSNDLCLMQAHHRVLMVKQWYLEALTVSYRIIETTRQNPKVLDRTMGHRLQGETYLALNQTEQAVNVLAIAYSVSSEDLGTILLLARAHTLLRNDKASEKYYSEAVELLGSDAPQSVLLDLGKLQLKLKKTSRAVDTLSTYVTACSNSTADTTDCSEGHFYLGKAQYAAGATDAACRSFYLAASHPLYAEAAMQELTAIATATATATATAAQTLTAMDGLPEVGSGAVEGTHKAESASAEVAATSGGEARATASTSSGTAPVPLKEQPLPTVSSITDTPISPTNTVPASPPTTAQQSVLSDDQNVASAQKYLLLARARLHSGDADGALKEISRALRKAPRITESYVLRADIHRQMSRASEAVADYLFIWNDLGEKNDAVTEAILAYATELVGQSRHAQALTLFQALKLPDNNIGNVSERDILSLARAHSGVGDFSAALDILDTYRSAVDAGTDPGASTTTTNTTSTAVLTKEIVVLTVDLLERTGQAERARALWLWAVEKNAVSFECAGDWYASQQNFTLAAEYYEMQVVIDIESTNKDNSNRRDERLAALHQKLGRIYAHFALNPSAAATTTTSTSAGVTSAVPPTSQEQSAAYRQQAHTHYVQAMQLGAHDTDMRRFFAQNPMPDLTTAVTMDKDNVLSATKKASAGGASSSGSSESSSTSGGAREGRSSSGAGKVVHDDSSPRAIPLHSHHRWVVRHIVDPADAGPEPGTATTTTEEVQIDAKPDGSTVEGSSSGGAGSTTTNGQKEKKER